MAFWIVYQGTSWDRARYGGYLWAPKVGKNGQTRFYWDNMKRVRPGDLILAGVDNAVRAIAEATHSAYASERPDPADEAHWSKEGWRLDVTYIDLDQPMFYPDWAPGVMSEMPSVHSPFHGVGKPNQGYLYALPNSVGEHVLSQARQGGIDLADRAQQVAPVGVEGETTRNQLIAARVGQGKFRDDLLARFGGACAILGEIRLELLRASHIKPWATANKVERLDPANGLLLSPMYDAAFDAKLISFADDSKLLLADDFPADKAIEAGIDISARISISDLGTRRYLAEHRAMMAARSNRANRLSL